MVWINTIRFYVPCRILVALLCRGWRVVVHHRLVSSSSRSLHTIHRLYPHVPESREPCRLHNALVCPRVLASHNFADDTRIFRARFHYEHRTSALAVSSADAFGAFTVGDWQTACQL